MYNKTLEKGVIGMERIITYDEIPVSKGQSIYFRMETDPKLYISLVSKGYQIVKNIIYADESTTYVTGRRQDYKRTTPEGYKEYIDSKIQDYFKARKIVKPTSVKFSVQDLIEHKYKLPFVLKNENQNGGREKFLIQTEDDYESLICACEFLLEKNLTVLLQLPEDDPRVRINYNRYLNLNFSVQDYIPTPSMYNTTIRLLTSPSDDLLYGALKYKMPVKEMDDTTLLGYLLHEIYPLSTPSIVSNTLSGGSNILLGEDNYSDFERELLNKHGISSKNFESLVETTKAAHREFNSELGIICGFDYIYDYEKDQWYLLEYHSRPMLGDYSKRQGIAYGTKEERLEAEGRIRATALTKTLKKTR